MTTNIWQRLVSYPAAKNSKLKDEAIREWYNRLNDGKTEIELFRVNLCPAVKERWPYISTVLKDKNHSSHSIDQRNFIWESMAQRTMSLHAPEEDYIIVTFGPEMVIGFTDEITALSVRLSLTFPETYDVEFGF
jgi:hypothetical protein